MFEKEAEEKGVEYANKQKRITSIHEDSGYSWGQVEEGYEKGFKDGAEFGYNKCKEEIDYLNKHWRSENERKEEYDGKCKATYIKGIRTMANALKDYDRTNGAWTDYFEHTVEEVLKRLLKEIK